MIKIDLNMRTYVCPFCNHDQAYNNSHFIVKNIPDSIYANNVEKYIDTRFGIYTLMCNNPACKRITVTAIRFKDNYQVDIVPKTVVKNLPDYIPEQIRCDFYEASLIINDSPKAASTLLRRCLQGMIHDFWGICEKNLNAEITALKEKVSLTQWNAMDSLRKIGNIGAHMEKDVNLVIDVYPEEAIKLLKLIELLIEKWYVARHDEEELLKGISELSKEKESKRKENDSTN